MQCPHLYGFPVGGGKDVAGAHGLLGYHVLASRDDEVCLHPLGLESTDRLVIPRTVLVNDTSILNCTSFGPPARCDFRLFERDCSGYGQGTSNNWFCL